MGQIWNWSNHQILFTFKVTPVFILIVYVFELNTNLLSLNLEFFQNQILSYHQT